MDELLKGAMTREEIASIYGICTKTLKKWLLRKGLKIPSGAISPSDQKKIFSKLGIPKQSNTLQIIP